MKKMPTKKILIPYIFIIISIIFISGSYISFYCLDPEDFYIPINSILIAYFLPILLTLHFFVYKYLKSSFLFPCSFFIYFIIQGSSLIKYITENSTFPFLSSLIVALYFLTTINYITKNYIPSSLCHLVIMLIYIYECASYIAIFVKYPYIGYLLSILGPLGLTFLHLACFVHCINAYKYDRFSYHTLDTNDIEKALLYQKQLYETGCISESEYEQNKHELLKKI